MELQLSGICLNRLAKQKMIPVLAVIVIFMGCSSTRIPILPGEVRPQEEKGADYHVLKASDEVKVELKDGRELGGVIVEASADHLVVGQTGNYGYDEIRVEAESIEKIEWVNGGSAWPFAIVLSVGAVVLYVVAYAGTLSHLN